MISKVAGAFDDSVESSRGGTGCGVCYGWGLVLSFLDTFLSFPFGIMKAYNFVFIL